MLIFLRFHPLTMQGKSFMAEEKKEPWLNYLALATVMFA